MDKHSERDELSVDAVPEILAFLDFKLCSSDYEFLKCYVEWRITTPSQVADGEPNFQVGRTEHCGDLKSDRLPCSAKPE